ncbi:aldehyde dehydrogenase family protein [Microbaculum marinisediminis]|uniref:Aldehyde dehydrogenase family protein n=1 Tax=Microbaculum marinisediminis TaxID=2931392 RepID=A0AAW5R3T3_9HYPH|nr:aldehyde dehydrogenase family protein [Microbaculum sp. A6E488]MCT8973784.1 aldehyde dehydrogenase family protein [Microbaculum sp. A6E488]
MNAPHHPASGKDWHAEARALAPQTLAFIDGDHRPARSGATFATVNPATGAIVAEVAACGAADVDDAVAAAARAFASGRWSAAAPAARKATLLRFADLIEADSDTFALLETLDMGKPIRDSLSIDVPAAVRCLRWFAETTDKLYDEIAPTASGTLAMVRRRPVGVVAAIVPWNFPLVTAMTKIAPALAAGNSVVLKPSELSPLSALRLGALASAAGLPDGVFNVVPGIGPEAGKALALHADVAALTFTGSTAVGKLLLTYAGQSNMKKVSLECGGKSANIVLADCPDLDRAVEASAMGAFQNQGQICNAGTRLILQTPIRDAFLEKLTALTRSFVPGDPLSPETRFGAMVSAEHAARVRGYIEAGLAQGATRLTGDGLAPDGLSPDTCIHPTLFAGVDNAMTIAREEIFGPVLSVIDAETMDQAIDIANDSDYGLAAAIWTRDIAKALDAESRLDTGFVWINTLRVGDITVPFGGTKASGTSRDKSLHAFDNVTHRKSVWVDLSARS